MRVCGLTKLNFLDFDGVGVVFLFKITCSKGRKMMVVFLIVCFFCLISKGRIWQSLGAIYILLLLAEGTKLQRPGQTSLHDGAPTSIVNGVTGPL